MVLIRLIIFICLLCSYACIGAPQVYTYDYNSNCNAAYQDVMSLHFAEAEALIVNEQKTNPHNLMATYLADYEDCIVLLMNCEQVAYEQRIAHFEQRLELLEQGDKSSPWFRFCKAGVYLHRAIVNIRFGEQYKATLDFHHSFSLLKDNEELFPAFEYNHVFAGLEEAVVGSLPGSYKWVASLFGMKGSVKKGTAKLTAFVNMHNASQPLYTETVLYYLYSRFYLLSEQKEVWNFINSPQFPLHHNLLNVFVKANIALDYRKSDAAIETLQAAKADPDYNAYAIFDYQMGMALVTRADTSCTWYFQQYLKKNKSDIYIKDVWQKVAFVWYINNNKSRAEWCMEQVKKQGTARLDADKQALHFAQNKAWPQKELLQARLLIDGGYSAKALTLLQGINLNTLSEADRAEYYFRLGRSYQEMADEVNSKQYFQPALKNYLSAITEGKERHEQFAARAALQMGKMYEQIGMGNEAVKMYNECLDMPSHDFQNSIDQQAKAGINRVENK